MEPWQSWAAAVCIGGAAFWYYARDSKYFMKPRETRSASLSELITPQPARRKNDKQSAKRKDASSKPTEAISSHAEAASPTPSNVPNVSKKRKAGRTPGPPSASTQNAAKSTPTADNDVEDNDDKEWARQLDASRRGVVIGSSKSEKKQKAKTQHQNETPSRSNPQKPVSNGQYLATSNKGDVSDMLEPTPAAATTLRVTGNSQDPKKPQTQKAEQTQETKKQRQNRRKVEEKKLQREEDEKQRQVLLNDQRRSAREARGEPAKNGVVASNPPARSAWSASAQASSQPNGSGSATAPVLTSKETPLLDTFEQDGLSTASSNEAHTNGTTPATVGSAMEQDLPSEETQLEMLNKLNENVGWNEVASKGKKSKKKQSATTIESATPGTTTPSNGKDGNPYSAIYTGDQADETEQPVSKGALQANGRGEELPTLQHSVENTPWKKGHPDDSDWAVY